jgi:CTP:molybdopterin cytidylyltransferase MocA
MGQVAAIVLAAGEASRFGSPKQRILLPRVLERLGETSVDEIVIVQGAHELEEASYKLLQGPPVRIVSCPGWERGPGASLHCGVEALGAEIEAAVVVLADGPNLAPEAVERVLSEWRNVGGIVAASYDGARSHPLVLGASDWTDIPDEGLRDTPVTLVPCDDLGAPGDVDVPEDL